MKHLKRILPMLFIVMGGCAYLDRGCSSCGATYLGADWVVVELTEAGGKPYRCWELTSTTVTSEQNSDGIYWKDSRTGNLIHVSGSYDYVQVKGGNWSQAFAQLGLTKETCALVRARRYDPVTEKYLIPKEKKPSPAAPPVSAP